MSRVQPKPDIKKMLKSIHSGNIAGLKHSNIFTVTKKKIMSVLEKNPHGICLEKFMSVYEDEYQEYLQPTMFGHPDVVELLKALADTVHMKLTEPNDKMLLYPKSNERKDLDEDKKILASPGSREEAIVIFHSIINSLGGISVDALLSEYKARTNQKLDIQKLGFDTFPSFLSHLSKVFKTCKRDGQVILMLGPSHDSQEVQDSQELQEHKNTADEENSRNFAARTTMNLRQLLEEEFPYGLQLSELYAAYEGFYGSSREDLDYEKHGYTSLEAFLAANGDVVSLQSHHGDVCVLPCLPLQCPKPEQINLSSMGCVVSPSEDYSLVEKLPSGRVEVVVAEVYSPKSFWVMHYGEHNSLRLDKLMDGMLEFYRSALGNRYKLPGRRVTSLMAVAALYTVDQNFYRAVVLSLEDLTTVKVFFVDYGTVVTCKLHQLRLLHKNFFVMPAQAIKCSLHGIVPSRGKQAWGRSCSKRLLALVQDQRLVAEVVSEEMTTVIKLWDPSCEEVVSIADLLVREGLATSLHPPASLQDTRLTPDSATSSRRAGGLAEESHIGSTSCYFDADVKPQQEEAETHTDHSTLEEMTSDQEELVDTHVDNSAISLPRTRSAASSYEGSMHECTQAGSCNSDPGTEAAAAARKDCFVTSTPEGKEVVTIYNDTSPIAEEVFVSDEECHEDDEDDDDDDEELDSSCLVHAADLFFRKKIHIIEINRLEYVLNMELPHTVKEVARHLALPLTVTQQINQDLYNNLIENACDVFEANGEVRANLALYPLQDLASVLALRGYSITTHHQPAQDFVQKSSHKHHSPETSTEGKDLESGPTPYMSLNSSAGGNTSFNASYRHGAQIEPLCRP